jgi:hypothetical protein
VKNAIGIMRGVYFAKNGIMEGTPMDIVLLIYQAMTSLPLINNHHLLLFPKLNNTLFPKKTTHNWCFFSR